MHIILSSDLKRQLKDSATKSGKSLSEYIRQAASERIKKEKVERTASENVIDDVFDSLEPNAHPELKDINSINKWVRELREEWEV